MHQNNKGKPAPNPSGAVGGGGGQYPPVAVTSSVAVTPNPKHSLPSLQQAVAASDSGGIQQSSSQQHQQMASDAISDHTRFGH